MAITRGRFVNWPFEVKVLDNSPWREIVASNLFGLPIDNDSAFKWLGMANSISKTDKDFLSSMMTQIIYGDTTSYISS